MTLIPEERERLPNERTSWYVQENKRLRAALSASEQRVAKLERELEEERQLREQIEDDHWPYEWQVATAEREKRKAAEQRAEQAERDNDFLLSSRDHWRELAERFVAERDAAELRLEALREALFHPDVERALAVYGDRRLSDVGWIVLNEARATLRAEPPPQEEKRG